jgi:DNA polymerase III delta' subunit
MIQAHKLNDVIGQTGVSRLFARLIDRKRLPHGLLLEGIPGCGRRTLALAVASALLCQNRRDGDACGSCHSCVLAAEGNHPDLVCLPHDTEPCDPEEFDVDAVRQRIVQQAFETPLLSSCRVFFLPDIERLHNNANNALLKVLEEPPPDSYLIMTTAHARAVIGTIRSRVQLYRLQPLTSADLELVLRRLGLNEPDARARAAQGLGSHRNLAGTDEFPVPLEQLLELCRGEFRASLVADIVAALPQKQPTEDDGSGRTLAREQRRVCGQWLHSLLQSLRSHLTGPQATAHADLIERVLLLERDLQRNINPRLIIEALSGF